MKLVMSICTLAIFTACSQTEKYVPGAVSAEKIEQQKPRLYPPGGLYLHAIEVNVISNSESLEYSTGKGFEPLDANQILILESAELIVRERKNLDLGTLEAYSITDEFPPLEITPTPGTYDGSIRVSATTPLINSRIEMEIDGEFSEFYAQNGIYIDSTTTLALRQCVDDECSESISYDYQLKARSHGADLNEQR